MRNFISALFLSLLTSLSLAATPAADIEWLPQAFKEKLKAKNCQLNNSVSWGDEIVLKINSIVVGQLAKTGQYDIAVSCGENVLIHWGGEAQCNGIIPMQGESIEIPNEDEIMRYLARYRAKNWPSTLSHDSLGMYYIGKSSFYRYCHEGKWLYSDGAD